MLWNIKKTYPSSNSQQYTINWTLIQTLSAQIFQSTNCQGQLINYLIMQTREDQTYYFTMNYQHTEAVQDVIFHWLEVQM